MSIIGISLEKTEEVKEYFKDTQERIKDYNMLRNPYIGTISEFSEGYILDIAPVYPNFTPYGVMLSVALYILLGWGWYVIPGLVIGSLGFFWSK